MSRNIRTLGDFNNDAEGDSGEESDNGQEFYVGGSEQSGQQVLGGPGNRDPRDALFQAARRAGAQEVHEEEHRPTRQMESGGVRLGRPGEPSESSSHEAAEPAVSQNRNNVVTVRMNLWENGFSLNDGPLREFSIPDNQRFLREIMQNQIPEELTAAYPRQTIDIHFERKTGPYVPPKAKPFEGTGARLGGLVPNVVTNDVAHVVPEPAPTEDLVAKAQTEVNLDSNSPTTQLQIRLNNGNRLIGRFNHEHTVSAVRNFIVSARPDMAFIEFQLMTTYPNKIIDDESISLGNAGLLNAVIVVKPVA